MKVVTSGLELRDALQGSAGVGFVATMGALHAGHMSLVRVARGECPVVVLSIFVNPLQFGPNEDYTSYPRNEADDLARAEAGGVDVVFMPTVEEMYPAGATTTVHVGPLADVVEGASRPGHFEGVATVVAKLFNLVKPTAAYFGQKDAQQVAVVKRMVADLRWNLEIRVVPTVREPDGVAVSSRNVFLDASERSRATALFRALRAGREALRTSGDPRRAETAMQAELRGTPGVEPDYASAVEPETFAPARPGGPTLLVVAARVGSTRLIDNLLVEAPAAPYRCG